MSSEYACQQVDRALGQWVKHDFLTVFGECDSQLATRFQENWGSDGCAFPECAPYLRMLSHLAGKTVHLLHAVSRRASALPGASAFTILLLLNVPTPCEARQSALAWSELPSLPDPEGFAGMYAGVSNGALIIAGGANFPAGRPWEGGTKVWYDRIFVLTHPDSAWRLAETRLPRPLAYGVSATGPDGVVLAGGSNAEGHHAEVYQIRMEAGRPVVSRLPDLPFPLAGMAGAMTGSTLYVAGGRTSPDAAVASHAFLALDLAAPDSGTAWQELRTWPGPARSMPVAGTWDGKFYLMSGSRYGAEIAADGTTRPVRLLPILTDAYRYSPDPSNPAGGTWERLADMPRGASAAPSPAAALGQGHLLIMGGVDTEHARHTDLPTYPPFSLETMAYHLASGSWTTLGTMPKGTSRVTAPAVLWQDRWAIVSGEKLPGIRSPQVVTVAPAISFGFVNWLFLAIYLGAILGMGYYFSKREKGTEDFFLAGRRIPWWAAGVSIYGTQLSAITFMALPALVYGTNWAFAMGSITILLVVPVVIYFYLPFYRRLNLTTAYEYLELRFGYRLRALGSLTFILLQCGRMGVVLFLPAIAISAVTGIDLYACIALAGVVCTIYTVLGGMEAVIWTDVLQVLVLVGGALMCLGIMVFNIPGGIGGLWSIGMQDGKFSLYNPGWSYTEPTLWVVMLGIFFLNLTPYTSDQTVIQRYLTTEDEKAARKSVLTTASISVPSIVMFYGLGTALYVFYKSNPDTLAAPKADELLPWFIVQELPIGFAGVVIAGLFAATMSSLDSSMNSIATAITHDFMRRRRPAWLDADFLKLAKMITVAAGALGTASAMLLATMDIKYLFDLFQEILGLLGGSLGGIFILGIFTRRASAAGALAGLAAGALIPWSIKQSETLAVHGYLYGVIGVSSCVLVGYIASRLLPGQRARSGLTIHSLQQ